jgi:hypothetical protein
MRSGDSTGDPCRWRRRIHGMAYEPLIVTNRSPTLARRSRLHRQGCVGGLTTSAGATDFPGRRAAPVIRPRTHRRTPHPRQQRPAPGYQSGQRKRHDALRHARICGSASAIERTVHPARVSAQGGQSRRARPNPGAIRLSFNRCSHAIVAFSPGNFRVKGPGESAPASQRIRPAGGDAWPILGNAPEGDALDEAS